MACNVWRVAKGTLVSLLLFPSRKCGELFTRGLRQTQCLTRVKSAVNNGVYFTPTVRNELFVCYVKTHGG